MQQNATQLTGLSAQNRAMFGPRFKQYCLSSVSALAMSLYPLQAVSQTAAQDKILFDKYDTRVDVAAAYTEVMYQVQRNLARYLSGTAGGVHEGLRAGDSVAQETYIDAIATAIELTEQPPAAGTTNALRTFPYAMSGSFDIAFRYCGGNLLSYFDTNVFKSNLTQDQIQNAPVLQAIREGKRASAKGLYILRTVGGNRELVATGGRTRSYPACFDTLNGVADALPDGTLLTVEAASIPSRVASTQKVGVERRVDACSAGTVGSGRQMFRDVFQDKNAAGKNVGARTPDATWSVLADACNAPIGMTQYVVENCAQGGIARYRFTLTQAQDPTDPFKTIWVPTDAGGNVVSSPVLVRDMLVGQCDNVPPAQKTLDPTSDTTYIETQSPSCNAAYPAYSGTLYGPYREERTRRERIFDLPGSSENVTQISYTNWASVADGCYRNKISDAVATRTIACPTSWVGVHRQQRTLRTTVTDYANPSSTDPRNVTVIRNWATVLNTCQPAPPSNNNSSSSGGKVDVDGDGIADFNGSYDAMAAGYTGWTEVSGSCGSCNGPTSSSVGSSGDGGSSSSGSSGGGGGGCFLTTAIVGQRGEADDGPTLSKLRNFRDTYMASNPGMAADIVHYYDVAPQLVATIPPGHKDWVWIESQVDQAVLHIDANELDEAYNVYRAMVEKLMADWIN